MKKLKSKNIILISLLVLVVALLGAVMYRGVSQSAIGDFSTQASCTSYAQKNFCASYDCKPCAQYNAGYTLSFSDGTKTSTPWTADCRAKGTGGSTYTLCPAVTTTTTTTTSSSSSGGYYKCYPAGTATTSYLCKAPVSTGTNTYGCAGSDLYSCPTTCDRTTNNCAVVTCSNACTLGTLRASGSGFQRCVTSATTTCTVWGTVSYCPSGQQFVAGACTIVTTTTPTTTTTTTPTTSCSVSFSCIDATHIDHIAKDCTHKTYVCGTGKECVGEGNCVSTAPVQQPSPEPVPAATTNLCDGVTCDDYCDAAYSGYSQGTCDGNNGQCVYVSVKTNSPGCLPAPAPNSLGDAVEVPARPATAPTWFDQYGYYIGGAVIVALLGIYLWLDKKEGKR